MVVVPDTAAAPPAETVAAPAPPSVLPMNSTGVAKVAAAPETSSTPAEPDLTPSCKNDESVTLPPLATVTVPELPASCPQIVKLPAYLPPAATVKWAAANGPRLTWLLSVQVE